MKHAIFLTGLLFVAVLVGCISTSNPTISPVTITPIISSTRTVTSAVVPPTNSPAPFRDLGTVQRNVLYCTSDEGHVLMDIYFPVEAENEPAQLLVFLHGAPGTKEQIGRTDLDVFLRRGYVVAAPNWRQPKDGNTMQVGIADAKCAVRYLRAHAEDYGIDPERIGAWGCSAGGWAASMLGVTDASAGLEGTGGFQEQSSHVKAVVTYDGIADMRTFLEGDATSPQTLFGVNSLDDPIVARLSPITHFSKDDAPFLIFASDSRDGAFVRQAEELYNGLQADGAGAELTLIKNAPHCGTGSLSELERLEMTAGFFDQTLK